MADGWRFDRFVFEPTERRLRDGAAEVTVGPRAMDVLRVLLERAGRLVTKSELFDLAWPGLVVEETNLHVQVSTLRRILGAGAITTVPGRGYRFAWPVEPLDATESRSNPAPGESQRTWVTPEPTANRVEVLPAPLMPLIGREQERTELSKECAAHRLVTVVGPGGIGKTRLALEVARDIGRTARFEAVAFCDLTSVTNPSLVASALAAAVGIQPGDTDAASLLHARLLERSTLLFIDNAEHVREAVAEVLQRALERAPQTSSLVTSQAPLAIDGEHLFRLGPLSLPTAGVTPAIALQSGSVALFVASTRTVHPGFALDRGNVGAVIEVCARLDGIPLALQLAAARVPQLGTAGVAARLGERFRLLSRPKAGGPDRHRALAATLDWSYSLLDEAERIVLRRLGVFAGEFGLPDAARFLQDATLDDWRILDLISQLVDRSFVVVGPDDPPRYRLLESVRLYALDRLLAARETSVLERAISLFSERGRLAKEQSLSDASALAFAAALELCARLPAGPSRNELELELQLALGPAVQTSSSPGCPRCESIYGRAVELARGLDAGPNRFKALWGYWQFLSMAGREREAHAYAEELAQLGAHLGTDEFRLEACHAQFSTSQLLGDARATLAQTSAAIELYDPDKHHRFAQDYGGHDPGVCAMGQGAVARWLTGDVAGARKLAMEAQRMGDRFNHAYTRAVGHYYASITYAAMGDADALLRSAAALMTVSSRYEMAVLLTEGKLFAARGEFELSQCRESIAHLRASYDEIVDSGDFGFVPFYATLVADALIRMDDVDAAEGILTRAESIAEEAGQGFFLPEVLRLRGVGSLRHGNIPTAQRRFEQAFSLARSQGAVSLERRAATSLAASQQAAAS